MNHEERMKEIAEKHAVIQAQMDELKAKVAAMYESITSAQKGAK